MCSFDQPILNCSEHITLQETVNNCIIQIPKKKVLHIITSFLFQIIVASPDHIFGMCACSAASSKKQGDWKTGAYCCYTNQIPQEVNYIMHLRQPACRFMSPQGLCYPVKVSRTMRLQSVHKKFGLGMRLFKAFLRIEYPVYKKTSQLHSVELMDNAKVFRKHECLFTLVWLPDYLNLLTIGQQLLYYQANAVCLCTLQMGKSMQVLVENERLA